ncbi:MAG: Druantia anti-phage system protein DruA [Thermoplasmata archaeon]
MNGKELLVPHDKDFIRKVHWNSVLHLRKVKQHIIEKMDSYVIYKFILDGKDLDVGNIEPYLVRVEDGKKADIFNWIKLHWSIPISSGYGRRLRYIVYDRGNSAIIGIIGLADPVYGLGDRDRFVGWSSEMRRRNLKHVMDAFVLGAVPPYSYVLGGKLVASLLTSDRIVRDFRKRYKGTRALISGEVFDGKLAAITTASALGKSSVYDRIKINGGAEFLHIGWSKGSGEFQFYNGIYDDLFMMASNLAQKSKNPKWGTGVRNRRAVIKSALKLLDLPPQLLYHNIKRELFLVPLGRKSLEYLKGESRQIGYYGLTVDDISEFAIRRWIVPRSQRRKEYLNFKKEFYSLFERGTK